MKSKLCLEDKFRAVIITIVFFLKKLNKSIAFYFTVFLVLILEQNSNIIYLKNNNVIHFFKI